MIEFTMRYSPPNHNFEHAVIITEIQRFSKSLDGEVTFIHLKGGQILTAEESLNTLEARFNHRMREIKGE